MILPHQVTYLIHFCPYYKARVLTCGHTHHCVARCLKSDAWSNPDAFLDNLLQVWASTGSGQRGLSMKICKGYMFPVSFKYVAWLDMAWVYAFHKNHKSLLSHFKSSHVPYKLLVGIYSPVQFAVWLNNPVMYFETELYDPVSAKAAWLENKKNFLPFSVIEYILGLWFSYIWQTDLFICWLHWWYIMCNK